MSFVLSCSFKAIGPNRARVRLTFSHVIFGSLSMSNGVEDVSNLCGIPTIKKFRNWTSILGEPLDSDDALPQKHGSGDIDSWRPFLITAFARLRQQKGVQVRDFRISEPLCGMLPGLSSLEDAVFSSLQGWSGFELTFQVGPSRRCNYLQGHSNLDELYALRLHCMYTFVFQLQSKLV